MSNERLRELSEKADGVAEIQAAILFLSKNPTKDLAHRLTVAEQLISKLTIKVNKLASAAIAAAEATAAAAAAATAAAEAATAAAKEAAAIAAAITIIEN